MGWDYQGDRKTKSGILVVSTGERVHAVDNARQDGEKGEGTSFDAASCTEVDEPIGTLEVSCWSKAYSGLSTGLCGVSWEGFLVCLGVCDKFDFSVSLEINGGPLHERPQINCAGHADINRERVETKNGVFTMWEIILFGIL